jgi:hypothetical protein
LQTPRQIKKRLNQNIPDIFMQIQLNGLIEWVVYPTFYLCVYLGRFNNIAKGNSCLFPGHNQFKRSQERTAI